MKSYSLCVVGAGQWGQNHIRTLQKLELLGGVVDASQVALDNVKKIYPSCSTFLNLDDTFKYNFDAYIVATPPITHYALAKKIINEKKHLLVEKPLTLSLRDAIDINSMAKENNVNLMVGHLLLFHPAFIKIKQMIVDGKIGNIQYIYSNRLNLGKFRNDENVLWSFAPHDISLFNYFFEEIPQNVFSSGADILQKGVHDTSITSLKYNSKRMGHIYVSWLHPFKEHRLVIVGSKGMIRFEDAENTKPLTFYNKSVDLEGDLLKSKSDGIFEIEYSKESPLEAQLKYFVSNMNGKIKKANGDSAVDVMKILELATKSLTSN